MKVCNHEITVMKINIQSTSTQINSCDSAYQKGNQKSKAHNMGVENSIEPP